MQLVKADRRVDACSVAETPGQPPKHAYGRELAVVHDRKTPLLPANPRCSFGLAPLSAAPSPPAAAFSGCERAPQPEKASV